MVGLAEEGVILDVQFPEGFTKLFLLSEADAGKFSPSRSGLVAIVEIVEVVPCSWRNDGHHI